MALTIKQTSFESRPYERCMKYGPEVLTDEELLAVIIRSGTKDENSVALSQRVLSFSNLKNGILNIMELSMQELLSIKGIGTVKAIQIKCIGELSKRLSRATYSNMPLRTANSIANLFMESMRHLKREKFMALMLDNDCNYIKEYEVSIGTVNASIASAREIFIEALRCDAVCIVLIHNHPSGNPLPSGQDISVTQSMIKAGQIIGVEIIDHIIIGDNKYISFKEKGLIS